MPVKCRVKRTERGAIDWGEKLKKSTLASWLYLGVADEIG